MRKKILNNKNPLQMSSEEGKKNLTRGGIIKEVVNQKLKKS